MEHMIKFTLNSSHRTINRRMREMFKYAIVKRPGKSLVQGITSSPELGIVDYNLALIQHANYIKALEKCGLEVTVLDADEEFPDSCFIEDTAVLTKNCAIISNPGAPTRNKEPLKIIDIIKIFYPEDKMAYITAPGTLEGGDVMMVGNHFYIGLSGRTNEEGAKQLISILEYFGHTGSIVELKEVLHLKTGLSYLENNNLLTAGEFNEKLDFKAYKKIIIPPDKSYSANSIWINGAIIVPKGYEDTKKLIEAQGYEVIEVDVSEFRKLDGGLSCLSLRF